MPADVDPSFLAAIDALSVPGILIGHRLISLGDENALLPDEAVAFARSVVAVRRASGAARIVARQLLAQVGLTRIALPKASSGAPVWPTGVVGSLSHDSHIAVASIAMSRDFSALGIDIEPAEPLPCELMDLVVTPQERAEIGNDPYGGRLLFAAKEAAYKAVYPLYQTFLDYYDIQVSLADRQAVVRNVPPVELRFCISKHLLVLAFLRAGCSCTI